MRIQTKSGVLGASDTHVSMSFRNPAAANRKLSSSSRVNTTSSTILLEKAAGARCRSNSGPCFLEATQQEKKKPQPGSFSNSVTTRCRHQLTVFVAITRATFHLADTVVVVYMHQAHGHQCFRTPVSVHHFHLETRNAITFVRAATVAINDATFYPHTHRSTMAHTAHCTTNSETNQHHSVRGSIQRKLVKAIELQGSSCRTTFNFASRESRR